MRIHGCVIISPAYHVVRIVWGSIPPYFGVHIPDDDLEVGRGEDLDFEEKVETKYELLLS